MFSGGYVLTSSLELVLLQLMEGQGVVSWRFLTILKLVCLILLGLLIGKLISLWFFRLPLLRLSGLDRCLPSFRFISFTFPISPSFFLSMDCRYKVYRLVCCLLLCFRDWLINDRIFSLKFYWRRCCGWEMLS